MSVLDHNGSAAHYELTSLAISMAYADDTWGEEDLYSVCEHLGLDMVSNWVAMPCDRKAAKVETRALLESVIDPEVRPRAQRIKGYF